MVRITEEIKKRMIDMRESGSTYSEICETLGVTKERCIAYLKDIKPIIIKTDAMTKEWQRAEAESVDVLSKMGFVSIHNLNDLGSVQSAWDYLVQKSDDGRWWLIDVTINGQKSVSVKRDVTVDGYEHAILLKTNDQWKLIRITMNVETILNFEK
jgi:hypothetical protein